MCGQERTIRESAFDAPRPRGRGGFNPFFLRCTLPARRCNFSVCPGMVIRFVPAGRDRNKHALAPTDESVLRFSGTARVFIGGRLSPATGLWRVPGSNGLLLWPSPGPNDQPLQPLTFSQCKSHVGAQLLGLLRIKVKRGNSVD